MATASDLAFRAMEQRLDAYLATRGVAGSLRVMLLATIENARAYFEYCEKAGKDPADKVALAEFLASKTIFVATMSQTETGLCYAAIAGFLVDIWNISRYAGKAGALGTVPVAAITMGIALLDAIEIGNSCNAARQVWYDMFLNPHTPIAEMRRQVRTTPMPPPLP